MSNTEITSGMIEVDTLTPTQRRFLFSQPDVAAAQAAYWQVFRDTRSLPQGPWLRAHDESARQYHSIVRTAIKEIDWTRIL